MTQGAAEIKHGLELPFTKYGRDFYHSCNMFVFSRKTGLDKESGPVLKSRGTAASASRPSAISPAQL